MPNFIESPAGHRIAYQTTKGAGPAVLFCCGYRSDMESTKATAIGEWCAANNVPFTRFDYFAHGATGGEFESFTIGQAMEDAISVIDHVAAETTIIVGSSMGAWVALNAALERRAQIRGLIGVASAPDFTERLMYARFTPEQRRELTDEGRIWVHSEYTATDYPITERFIHEARTRLLLDDVIGLDIPVHLFHGQEDVDVPWETSVQLANQLLSDEVTVTLIKDGDHRLNRPSDLNLMLEGIARIRSMVFA